jgi:hypothetical protein
MDFEPVFDSVRKNLCESTEFFLGSGEVAALLGIEQVSKYDAEKAFAEFSDTGPIHCRFVDIVGLHSWRLRFWMARH